MEMERTTTESSTESSMTTRQISVFRNALGDTAFWARGARRLVAGVLAAAMLPMSAGLAFGQEGQVPPPPPDYGDQGGPPPSNYQPLGPEQIDQLVAPISLYPDSLVAQILAASTYPAQVATAQQFVQQNGNYPPQQLAEMANGQPWDPSVKSLVAFPQVLNDMNQNMDWTTQLGNAYYNQPQDVMSAVQVMRQRAYAAGTLRSSNYLDVAYQPGDIAIDAVNPSVVYVPYYNPWAVYGAPIPVYAGYYWGPPRGVYFAAGVGLGFGLGIAIGAFSHFGWGYHSWAPNWRERTVVFNHANYISRSNTVINHGHFGAFNRGGGFNRGEGARFGGGNRTTYNHVTINRGGNVYNRGGNTVNRGYTYNRGGQTINRANTYNRGAAQGARTQGNYNRGEQHRSAPAARSNGGGHEEHHGGSGHEEHHQ